MVSDSSVSIEPEPTTVEIVEIALVERGKPTIPTHHPNKDAGWSSQSQGIDRPRKVDDEPVQVSNAPLEDEQLCVIKIMKQLNEVKPYQVAPSIFEVPRSLRELHPDAYLPRAVSIGPYHRKAEHLKEMEKHKLRLLQHVLGRTVRPLDYLVGEMFQLEEDTRNCYDKPIEGFTRQQFVEMMLLDACFIVELLSGFADERESCGYESDPWVLFLLQGSLSYIQGDLLMLGNQLPLSVLDRWLDLTWGAPARTFVADLALRFFDSVIPGISDIGNERSGLRMPLHLLDIVRQSLEPSQLAVQEKDEDHEQDSELAMPRATRPRFQCIKFGKKCWKKFTAIKFKEEKLCLLKPCRQVQTNGEDIQDSETTLHSVTRLRGTGIKFATKNSKKFLDIEFQEGRLLIPPLMIHDATKSVFLNLMALEQCYTYPSSYVTSYIRFMDGLINSPKDVDQLNEKRIIVHELGSEEDVATLFNSLGKEIVFDSSNDYLSDVCHDLKGHYDQKWRSWWATLKQEYLKDPWKIISIGAASFLILLTAAQTAYTIVGYHHPSP